VADPLVRDVAGAIVDGEAIDWPAVDERFESSSRQSIADGLKTISRIATPAHAVTSSHPSSRLHPVLAFARAVAILSTAVGTAGAAHALLFIDPTPRRLRIILATQLLFAVTAIILDAGATDRRTRSLGLFYWTMAAGFSASGVAYFARSVLPLPPMRWLTGFHAECFFAPAVWQFARDFPMLTRFSRLDRVSEIAIKLTTLVALALFIVNLVPVIAPGSVLSAWAAPYQVANRAPLFWNMVFGTALPALAVIAWRGRSATGNEASRVRLFLYGVTLAIAPAILEVLLEGLSPAFREVARTDRWRSIGAWLYYPAMFLMPVVTVYAVRVGNVLEIRVVMQRALRYLLARWLVVWGAVAPVGALMVLLYKQSARPLAEVMSDSVSRTLLAAAAIALLVVLARERLLHLLDRWALPGVDDRPTVLARMTEELKHTRSPLEVGTEFARAVDRALQAPAHAFVVHEGELVPARDGTPPPPQSLVPVLLEGSREPCVVAARQRQSYYALMTAQDRAWIDKHDISVLIPIVSGRSGGLLGMVALAQRRNALTFSADDLRFLRACAGAASLACDVIDSHSDYRPHAAAQEVALECGACGHVDEWRALRTPCSCGTHRWEPSVLPRDLLGRYSITQKLGAGGMGVVYRATETALSREIAVKTLTRLSPGAASRLRLEARTMAALTHAHVAVLYGLDEWQGTPLLRMEYLKGGTLSARIRRGRLPAREAVGIVRQLAAALDHMHRRGHCHGDIKPSNIGFTAEGVPKFLDFGLSRAIVDGAAPEAKDVGGTRAYMSPEMHDGDHEPVASDVWALGVVLYECITGINPFAEATSREAIAAVIPEALNALQSYSASRIEPCLQAVFRPVNAQARASANAFATSLQFDESTW
jgi:hypothetical protein